MRRHEAVDLWGYAARELSLEDAKYTEAHLPDCPDCRAALSGVQKAQGVLGSARLVRPRLSVAGADAAVAKEVSRLLLKKARPVRWGLWLTPAAVAAAALVAAAVSQWPSGIAAQVAAQGGVEAEGGVAPSAAQPAILVPAAAGPSRPAAAGETLSAGPRGPAVFTLPDTSRLRLAASSRLQVARASVGAVELELQKGRVAVHAAHVPREAFAVRAGDVTVQVLGTTFAVTRGADFVEVAVSEGRVGVESPRGLPFFVSSGERVRVGTKSWRPVSRAIGAGLRDELKEAAPPVPAAGGAVVHGGAPAPTRTGAKAEASRGQVDQPVPAAAPLTVPLAVAPLEPEKVGPPEPAPGEWEQLPPRQSRAPIGLRGIAEPNPPAAEAQAPAAQPAAANAGPSAPPAALPSANAGAPEAAAPAPAPAAARAPVASPAPAVAPAAAAPAPVAEVRGPLPEDLEELFLMRAERALRNGGCDRYLLGLADVAEDPQRTVRQERARIAIARCQQALGQHEAAAAEFARYARDFPKGLFAREAAAVVAAQPAVAK